jgi:hypothetical protein
MTDRERTPAGAARRGEVRRAPAAVLPVSAAGVALWLVFFHRALSADAVFASRDMLRVVWPLRLFWRVRLLEGSWPGWFPGESLGESFTGLPIAAAFHPLGVLALLMDVGKALTWVNLLAFPVAFAGAFLLCRAAGSTSTASLLGAIAYTFGGYLVGVTATQPYLLSAAALPWAFWAALGLRSTPSARWLLGAVLASTCILFGGDPQAWVLAVGGLALLVLFGPGWRGRLLPAAAVFFLSLAAGTVQWLPSLLASAGSAHVMRASLTWAERLSLHPLQLLDTVWGPTLRGPFEDDASVFLAEQVLKLGASSLWVQSTYLGPVVLGLAVLGLLRTRWRGWLLIALATLLLLALGRYGFLYGLLYRWLPGWSTFRYPVKVLPFVLLLLAWLGARGLDAVGREEVSSRRLSGAWLLLALVSATVVLLERTTGAPGNAVLALAGAPVPDAAAARIGAGISATGVRVAVVCVVAAALVRFGWRAPWLPAALSLVVFLDLFAANEPTYEVVPRGAIEMPPTASAILASAPADFLRRPRVSTAVDRLTLVGPERDRSVQLVRARVMALENGSQWLWGLETADAYLPLASWWVWRLEQDRLFWVQTGHRLFSVSDMLASDAIVAAMGPLAPPVVARWPEHGLVLMHQGVLPRAYLARRSCVGDERAAWERLHAPGFEVGREALVGCSGPTAGEGQGTVRAVRWEAERIELEVDGNGGELVVNEAFARGWTATIDGAQAAIERVNLAVRGVPVPPGPHVVLLRYRTPGLRAGAIVSALVLAGLLAAVFARRPR